MQPTFVHTNCLFITLILYACDVLTGKQHEINCERKVRVNE